MRTVSNSPPFVHEREFITSISTTTPACRMLVLFIDRSFGPVEISHFPVVAIETTVRHYWFRRDPAGRPDHLEYGGEAALRAAGYRFHHREIVHTPLIATEFGHVISLADLQAEHQSDTCRIQVKVCDWPADEDDSRFDAMSSQSAANAPVSLDIVAVAKAAIGKPATAAAAKMKSAKSGPRC